MKTGWLIAGAAALSIVTGGVVYAIRSSGREVPPKPKDLTKFDSEVFEYRGRVLVLDRRNPRTAPNKWRWRLFTRKAYGDGREIDGKQYARRHGLTSRRTAYLNAVEYVDHHIEERQKAK